MSTSDLPPGYRWCNERETERYQRSPGYMPNVIIVRRTTDSEGHPYTQGEADLAIQIPGYVMPEREAT